MNTLEQRLRLKKPLAAHVSGILSLVVSSQTVMSRIGAMCERFGITRPQYNVLRILRGAHPDGHPRHEIAARVVENAPDVTRILDRLVDAGLVQRTRSSADKRESLARITGKGLRLLKRVERAVSAEEDQIGKRLSREDWLQLSRLCGRIFYDET